MSLGSQLKTFREDVDFSQSYIANELEISRQSISNWKNDKNYPDMDNLIKLSNLYGFNLNKLIDENQVLTKIVSNSEQAEAKTIQKNKIESYLLLLIICFSSLIPPFGILLAAFTIFINKRNNVFYILIYVLSAISIIYNLYAGYSDIIAWMDWYRA